MPVHVEIPCIWFIRDLTFQEVRPSNMRLCRISVIDWDVNGFE
jgi:hypothetical protein